MIAFVDMWPFMKICQLQNECVICMVLIWSMHWWTTRSSEQFSLNLENIASAVLLEDMGYWTGTGQYFVILANLVAFQMQDFISMNQLLLVLTATARKDRKLAGNMKEVFSCNSSVFLCDHKIINHNLRDMVTIFRLFSMQRSICHLSLIKLKFAGL